MTRLPLSFAAVNYDRFRALEDGRVTAEGIDLNFVPLPVEEIFYRQVTYREFDVSEMSLSSYVLTLNDESPPFIALPAFPSRYAILLLFRRTSPQHRVAGVREIFFRKRNPGTAP